MLLTQRGYLLMEAPCAAALRQENGQKLNNLISTPLLTSPSLSSLSHLLSFPHVCLRAIPASSSSAHPSSPQISSHIFPPIALICSRAPSSLISPHSSILSPATRHPHLTAPRHLLLHIPLFVSLVPHLSPKSNLQICTHIESMNNFKHFDRKH